MNRKRVAQERKYFWCEEFGHIMRNCRAKKVKKVATLQSSNKFEVLASRIINRGEGSKKEVKKDRKIVLREERAKKKKERPVEARKAEEGKSLKEVTVKIGLERIDMQK